MTEDEQGRWAEAEDERKRWATTHALKEADALNRIMGPAIRAYVEEMRRLSKTAGRPLHSCIPGDGTYCIEPEPNAEAVQSVRADEAVALAVATAMECCVPRPGEPSFVLLGRDAQAPALVERWADDREAVEPGSGKPAKAREIASRMRGYRAGL